MRALRPALVAALVLAAAGCGGSSGPSFPTIGAAKTYELTGFEPAAPAKAGVPTRISFAIRQPSGKQLTAYRRGSGPHTGIHLILVRSDLGAIIHRHPPLSTGRRPDRVGRLPDARALARRRRRLPGQRAAAELPALPLDHRRRAAAGRDDAAVRADAGRRRLHASPSAARRSCTRSRRPPSTSRSPTRRASRRGSRRGSARSRTRSSSARARSPTSTPTSARRGRPRCSSTASARRSSASRPSRAG